ncbi:MAG: 50S ribosomal protein L4 [Candidatus Kerfeldbacteria bacterium CG15_BIG_FIL_POST_REV_8_21_14_020_45_12]|uniref:Large ribosomal subunit protein uL4 n=1 Tax=Candidatus Kerfeldbacteria bacterium CG15_BIG_FIL_POST_REV_8_21_14_020_45_12 TaxID=2014247 RepID=A0A2M7H3Q7_9BACT|nr:MAG: 50S ribosomal protein L4 [Candidatus Kerfeldbacteria bacterium CG15_BIG_FIL_POST_REV_8_21_14_020_45_12]PJA93986.1 MAG: 50S ribosomal protein L4 [Candidatus Kerfeldbacteria bacterium CG_4_9_14_3_um_filter_45_8]
MLQVPVYNLKGEETGKLELSESVFAVKAQPVLVQSVARAMRANAASPFANTKGRAEKRGGGRKPWRQKGTGRARHGSSRSPIWRGGGVTFGPTSARNQEMKINKKEKRSALAMMLSDKVTEQMLVVVESWDDLEGKTSQLVDFLNVMPTKGRSVLVASGEKNDKLIRAANNIQRIDTSMATSLNVFSLLNKQYLVIDAAGIKVLTEQYS